MDETGVNIAMARPYARAPKGQRVYAAVPVTTGKNLTALGAFSLTGIEESMTMAGSSDVYVFSTCIEDACVPVLRPGQTVIMDNLSSDLE